MKTLQPMLLLAAAIATAYADCGKTNFPPKVASHIIGGEAARPGGWPWQVSIRYYGSHFCGGSIIDDQWIVSAAHCFSRSTNPSYYKVHVGEHDFDSPQAHRQIMEVEKIIKHNAYSSVTGPGDIALLKLKKKITFGNYSSPVCLPNRSTESGDAFVNNNDCWATGWGYTKYGTSLPKILQQVNTKVLSQATCTSLWAAYARISSYHICFGGIDSPHKGICDGDKGGPMVCKRKDGSYVLLGISSWGLHGCKWGPSVFTRVTEYLDWIAFNKK